MCSTLCLLVVHVYSFAHLISIFSITSLHLSNVGMAVFQISCCGMHIYRIRKFNRLITLIAGFCSIIIQLFIRMIAENIRPDACLHSIVDCVCSVVLFLKNNRANGISLCVLVWGGIGSVILYNVSTYYFEFKHTDLQKLIDL